MNYDDDYDEIESLFDIDSIDLEIKVLDFIDDDLEPDVYEDLDDEKEDIDF